MTRIEWANCIPDDFILSKDEKRVAIIEADPYPLDPREEFDCVSDEDIAAYEAGEVYCIGTYILPDPDNWPRRADNGEYVKLTPDNIGLFCIEATHWVCGYYGWDWAEQNAREMLEDE